MLGLVLKDLYTLKRYGKILSVMISFFVVMGALQQNLFFITGMLPMLCMMMVVTTMSYDEYSRWHRLALSMPYTRREIVWSKYLIVLFLSLTGLVISSIIGAVATRFIEGIKFSELMLTAIGASLAVLFLISVLLPLIYQFGVEKSRIMLFGLTLIPFGAVFLLNQLGFPKPSPQTLKMLATASPVICLIAIGLSYQISCSIFAKKDL